MNKDIKFTDVAHKNETEAYLQKALIELVNDYMQPVTNDEMDYLVSRVLRYLKFANLNIRDFENSVYELTVNYTAYRKINAAIVITAIAKVNRTIQ